MISGHTDNLHRVLAGTILIVTMWIVLVLAGLVLVFTHTIKVEATAAANYQSGRQASAAAMGAIEFARAIVAEDVELLPEDYEAMEIGSAWMWMLKPSLDSDSEQFFGLIDLAARININNATEQMLLKLPEMTSELAAAIIDWQDEDEQVTPGGAESEYYLLQAEPYQCKNGPFETVEELLLVKGATVELLYGEDANRNGILDPNENDGDLSEPLDDSNGRLDRGLLPYLTVYSREINSSRGGDQQKININDLEGDQLQQLLYEQFEIDRAETLRDLIEAFSPRFDNLFQLVTEPSITMTTDELSLVINRLTVGGVSQSVGLINVNTAPRQILACLPGLDEADADALISHRESSDKNLDTIVWVLDAVSAEKALGIAEYITAETYQYAADIVTIASSGRGFARRYVVIDATQQSPRILMHQELTALGWPLDRTIIDELRKAADMQDILRKVER